MVSPCKVQRRPSVGDRVDSAAKALSGTILVDDNTSELSYKILFDNGAADWVSRDDVHHEGAAPRSPPAVLHRSSVSSVGPRLSMEDADARSVEGFFRRNPYFLVPWLILWSLLYAMRFIPPLQVYFDNHGMELFGLTEAAKLTIWSILCSYALHGFIAVNYDEFVEQGLKVVGHASYNWKCGDASIRSSLIYTVGMMTYALVPMRMAAADTTVLAIKDFVVGYAILLVAGDAWFTLCHVAFHSRMLYRHTHKTHHTWKHPVSFAAYYITSHTHLIQEHLISLPVMLFCPVPCSAFMFWEYYGVPSAQMQHSGFSLEKLRIPYIRIQVGHIMDVCGLCLGHILGSQSTANHDHHHEHFHGNFQLSYSYIDRLMGTYVEDKEEDCCSLEKGLLVA